MSVKPMDIAERFWRHVRKEDGEDGCWIWTGGRGNGYGMFMLKRRQGITAHRMALILSGVSIGPHQVARHVCPRNNKLCVRHVAIGSKSENMLDASELGTSCTYTKETVQAIRDEYDKGQITQRELARKYNVTQGHVSRLVNSKQRNF